MSATRSSAEPRRTRSRAKACGHVADGQGRFRSRAASSSAAASPKSRVAQVRGAHESPHRRGSRRPAPRPAAPSPARAWRSGRAAGGRRRRSPRRQVARRQDAQVGGQQVALGVLAARRADGGGDGRPVPRTGSNVHRAPVWRTSCGARPAVGALDRGPRSDAARMVFPWQQRERPAGARRARPAGQVLTDKFPVLHFGRVPSLRRPSGWDFRVWGEVEEPFTPAMGRVPQPAGRRADARHPLRHALVEARHALGGSAPSATSPRWRRPTPEARFVIFHAEGGFTSNVPIETAMRADCLLAWSYDGKPLSSPTTAIRCEPSCPARTSGRARSGCAASSSAPTTSPASGSATATTTTPTHGRRSATRAPDRGGRPRPGAWRGRSAPRRDGLPCGRSPGSARSSSAR